MAAAADRPVGLAGAWPATTEAPYGARPQSSGLLRTQNSVNGSEETKAMTAQIR